METAQAGTVPWDRDLGDGQTIHFVGPPFIAWVQEGRVFLCYCLGLAWI